jgi:hypothetical protein
MRKSLPINTTDARMMMFHIWAYERICTSIAADILIHASLHVHLSQVLSGEDKPIERLQSEYTKRKNLETIFPFLVVYNKESKSPLSDEKMFDLLYAEPTLEDVPEDQLKDIVIEWRRRHADVVG